MRRLRLLHNNSGISDRPVLGNRFLRFQIELSLLGSCLRLESNVNRRWKPNFLLVVQLIGMGVVCRRVILKKRFNLQIEVMNRRLRLLRGLEVVMLKNEKECYRH